MSPNCCDAGKSNRTVTLFVPTQGGATWNVPIRDEDERLLERCSTNARFCPFCGAKLGLEHVSIQEPFPAGETPEDRSRLGKRR